MMTSLFLLLCIYCLIDNVAVAPAEKGCVRYINQTSELFGETKIALTSGYPNNFECIWRAMSSSDYIIMLEVQDIETYNQTLANCSGDYVQVTGTVEGEAELIKTCLTENISSLYYYSPITIEFHSDNNSDSGIRFIFIIRWAKFLRWYSGRIESPGYPNDYPTHASLVWVIEAPMGFHIQITFDVFILEDPPKIHCWDYVKVLGRSGFVCAEELIIDPENTDVGDNEERYCGKSLAQRTRTSIGRRIEILFHSDFSNVRQGFTASWITVCGNEFTDSSGELTGPNYALGYPENQNCTWNIRVHNGCRLLLTLNVTSSLDRNISLLDCVQLSEWQNETALAKAKYYSGSFTFEFYNSMAISFLSDNDSSTGMSFNVSWTSTCRKTDKTNVDISTPDEILDIKHTKSSYSVADVILQAAVGPLALIILMILMLLIVKGRSVRLFEMQKNKVPQDTKETGLEMVNLTDKGILEKKLRCKLNFGQTIGFQPNIFRPRLPTPPMITWSLSSAEVWESMGFENNSYNSVNVDRTKELYLNIGESSTYAACKEVARNEHEDECINTFGSGVDGIVFTVGEDNVADTLKRQRRLGGKAFTDMDCTNNALQNEGYITSITLDSSSRTSSSDLDSYYFELEVDVHHKVDD